ncbi:MAG TPA: decarboxylating NADP(+)-dependent phosphogluconate dehydrogenase [bacterium]|nr:decarboxylating NADP(+)-dependent phosphogluconate dehydrogenase [bacterium]HPR89326.1 decarboxylating NADP(+)-dependent phosphogluconate dehydrogenase [bacterium]
MKSFAIGVVGLGVMGRNLALNIERHGYPVAGFDLDLKQRQNAAEKFSGKQMTVCASMAEFLQALESPRKILMMVPAGKPVDAVIHELTPHLSPGDILIDGGNTYFPDTERRTKELTAQGFHYIGTGVSGGEEGALRGPSIMPGGSPAAWPHVKPILQAIAAKVADGTPCCEWVGNGGAGHFVKMVHNGIEYGDMQMICEAYFLMEQLLGLSAAEMQKVFAEWNQGELNSYLIEITADIMAKTDDRTGRPMIEVILDTAGQKGTGKWTSQVALDLGVPAPTIAEAVFARTLSAIKEERVAAARLLPGPAARFSGDKKAFIEQIRSALYAAKICSYAQGFQLMAAASKEFGYGLHFGQIALLWRGGCIIRAQFLEKIKQAFDDQPDLPNLLLAPYFREALARHHQAWRSVVSTAVEHGLSIPAFSSALAYYDGYRSGRLPANLLQAQRDYFGAHTYERNDAPRGQFFHTEWL